jgi:ankyrin repeat protein
MYPCLCGCSEGSCRYSAYLLAQQGANLNALDDEGNTPVFVAAENGHVDIIGILVKHEADLNTAMSDGCTPVFLAAHNDYVDIVRVLQLPFD